MTTPTQPLEPLPGTVKLYQRHLFVCTGRADWPSHVEQDGGYMQALNEAVAARAGRITQKVKITACDQPGEGSDGYDILVFPDAIRYRNVTPADFSTLIEDHLIGNQPSPRLAHRPLAGDHHIFVCIHGRRDARCGDCGPPLAERFEAGIAARGLTGHITVYRTSHVGGHAYAGNVLIYPGGDWYGYVTPADAPRILDDHCLYGRLLPNHWRGRLGLTPEQQRELLTKKINRETMTNLRPLALLITLANQEASVNLLRFHFVLQRRLPDKNVQYLLEWEASLSIERQLVVGVSSKSLADSCINLLETVSQRGFVIPEVNVADVIASDKEVEKLISEFERFLIQFEGAYALSFLYMPEPSISDIAWSLQSGEASGWNSSGTILIEGRSLLEICTAFEDKMATIAEKLS